MSGFILNTMKAGSEIPYALLLLADETIEAIEKYIFKSDVYILNNGIQDIAVMALYKNSLTELEIKNMAVMENFRSQGIGSILIDKAKEIAAQHQFSSLLVGTSDTGLQQIRFYEKNGFVKKEIRKDFFTENYPFPIFENGMQMRDMIVLEFLIHHLSE
ncbi:ribosomal protein S18 acetylase RimI-like enzyme [Chryseobacterium sp. H1D6B]|uniref:GNAT family N-acetyltransferase n=1 Tax=Chryseobacterium sp. H1D6B TaxID=2940588 RepID=UPI0015C8C109|nr:GNAT family N-acetyltransferase [Chryseobacterium sp. H1D6B]MDH6252746.1 ribosomal protein S18 acetylase RimI-like enzyme [Chryseobacterium sp. H1D6B]